MFATRQSSLILRENISSFISVDHNLREFPRPKSSFCLQNNVFVRRLCHGQSFLIQLIPPEKNSFGILAIFKIICQNVLSFVKCIGRSLCWIISGAKLRTILFPRYNFGLLVIILQYFMQTLIDRILLLLSTWSLLQRIQLLLYFWAHWYNRI